MVTSFMESKAPLIYGATPQWFISMQKWLEKKLFKQLIKLIFIRTRKRATFINGRGRPDWCVSDKEFGLCLYQYLLIKKQKNL